MAKKKHKTRTGALTKDTGAAERQPKKAIAFKSSQNVNFILEEGKATVDLGEANTAGKKIAVYLDIDNKETDATWAVDLAVNCNEYNQTRTIPNGVTTSWHHIGTNASSTTNAKLIIYTTSDHKETDGTCNIKII